MKQDLEGYLADLAANRRRPLLLLTGDDLQVAESCRAIIEILVPIERRSFNLEHFDGRTANWEQIESSLRTPPFFPGKKILWVDNAPYFYSREQSGEISEQILDLWRAGKREDAAKRVIDLLSIQGWTQQQWDDLDPAAANLFQSLLGLYGADDQEEAQALFLFCRSQPVDLTKRKAAEANRLNVLLDDGLPEWSFLLLTASQVDRRTRLFKRFDEFGAVLNLGLDRDRSGKISRESLIEFISRELRRTRKTLEPAARELLLERSGDDLRGVQQEIEKLALFVGDRPSIRCEDVKSVVVDRGAAWIFDLTRALGERDGLAALAQLGRLISQGEHPLRILATVGAEVRRLIAARQLLDGELAKVWRRGITFAQFQQKIISSGTELLGRSMFGDYLSFQRADRFSLGELSLFMRGVFEADIRLKSTAVDPRMVLEKLFLDFCLRGSLTSGRESIAR
jgi:DNA polymerase-3 subunit delta